MWLNWKVGQSQSAAIAKEVAVVTPTRKVYDYGLLASLGAAGLCADRMRAAVEALRLIHPGSQQGLVTISMGVAELDLGGGMSIEQWLNDADTALYDAKASGRNRVRLANEHAIGQPDVEAPALHVVPSAG